MKKLILKQQRNTKGNNVKEESEWNPGYYKGIRFIPYDKTWYCNYNKVIHPSEKEYLNCKHCNIIK